MRSASGELASPMIGFMKDDFSMFRFCMGKHEMEWNGVQLLRSWKWAEWSRRVRWQE